MCSDKLMYIEWLLLMNPDETRERLMDLELVDLKKAFSLYRLQQIDNEAEEVK